MQTTLLYTLVCNCGTKISASTEKGLRKLMMKHINEGEIHLCWKEYYKITEETELYKILKLGNKYDPLMVDSDRL